jgi:hypothetical protein
MHRIDLSWLVSMIPYTGQSNGTFYLIPYRQLHIYLLKHHEMTARLSVRSHDVWNCRTVYPVRRILINTGPPALKRQGGPRHTCGVGCNSLVASLEVAGWNELLQGIVDRPLIEIDWTSVMCIKSASLIWKVVLIWYCCFTMIS